MVGPKSRVFFELYLGISVPYNKNTFKVLDKNNTLGILKLSRQRVAVGSIEQQKDKIMIMLLAQSGKMKQ